jgi:hypothetical protein
VALVKFVYLLWETESRPAGENRRRLLERCAPAILALGVVSLVIDIDDEFSTVKSPAPKCYRGPEISALLSVEAAGGAVCEPLERVLREAGFTLAGYEVEASLYTDYGRNAYSRARDWPDGERSPGVVAVTLLTRPRRLSREEWIRRWHGRMSPISERIQPRQRYVRNVILRGVTPDAPAFDGIVEEVWPSAQHISNPYLFYCADNTWQLLKHMGLMLYAILQFHNLLAFRTTTMSEYLVRTAGDTATRRAPSRGDG